MGCEFSSIAREGTLVHIPRSHYYCTEEGKMHADGVWKQVVGCLGNNNYFQRCMLRYQQSYLTTNACGKTFNSLAAHA